MPAESLSLKIASMPPSAGGARLLATALAILIGAASTLRAADPIAPSPTGASPARRPRLALVLSGGGARGAAHVGVLEVLEELHVKPDIIVATSMGSIVGGLYAAGYTPEELRKLVETTDWKDVFVDAVARRDRSFRRKQDDATFLIPGKLRFRGWKPYIPPALLGGQQLELLLRSLEIESQATESFDDLPIPFRAVALDLGSGEAVVLDRGSLATAMRASMAVPGVFAPVLVDGRRLVDGGEAANLPVGIAQSLGAEAVIAVDITTPLNAGVEIESLFSVMSQWSSFSAVANRVQDIKRLRPGDVLITPELGDIGFIDFARTREAMAIGEKAARAAAESLKRFAVPQAEWEQFTRRHRTHDAQKVIVDEVRFTNESWVDDRIIQRRLTIPTGKALDPVSFEDTVMRLYGLDYFGPIRHRYDREDGKGILSLDISKKPYGKNSLQFGASFYDDFNGEANYTFSIRHLLLAANRRGGEWENVAQIGQTRLLRTSFYQPLDFGMRWFVSPTAENRREYVLLYDQGEPVSEESITTNAGYLDFGRVFGESWDARVGPYYAQSQTSTIIGSSSFTGVEDEKDVGVRLALHADTRDSTVFPRQGVEVLGWYRDAFESWGADADRQIAHLDASLAATLGRVTLVPSFSGQSLVTGPTSFASSCALGGFLGLSGLGFGELRGERCVLGRTVAYIQLSHIDLGPLTSRVYGGLSLEAGNAYFRDDAVTWQSLTLGGSLFAGAQTPIGPVFVAWGSTEHGDHRIYFVIGQRF